VTPKRIAVIDDDLHIRQVLAAALGDEGYETILLPNAQEAAAYLRTTVPDLIFLDIVGVS
jgi:DNA-binding response OmpR family regulator